VALPGSQLAHQWGKIHLYHISVRKENHRHLERTPGPRRSGTVASRSVWCLVMEALGLAGQGAMALGMALVLDFRSPLGTMVDLTKGHIRLYLPFHAST